MDCVFFKEDRLAQECLKAPLPPGLNTIEYVSGGNYRRRASLVHHKHQVLEGFPTTRQRHQLFPTSHLQKQLQEQRQHVMTEFEQGHQFLKEREQHLLGQLARLEQELTEGREKHNSRGVSELARLAGLISELEGKVQQPAAELMKVRDFPRQGAPPCHSPAGPRESRFPWGPPFLI